MPTSLTELPHSADIKPSLASLAEQALVLLRRTLASHGHEPDEDQWKALTALLVTFDGIVSGTLAAPALYVSALDAARQSA